MFVLRNQARSPVAEVCPGISYSVVVDYGSIRRALITTSVGTLGAGSNGW